MKLLNNEYIKNQTIHLTKYLNKDKQLKINASNICYLLIVLNQLSVELLLIICCWYW